MALTGILDNNIILLGTLSRPKSARRINFTDKRVRALAVPPKGAAYTYDEEVPSLAVRVTAKGVRTFIVTCRVHGKSHRITLGRVDKLRLSDARDEAKAIAAVIAANGDPVLERKAARQQQMTFTEIWTDWRCQSWHRLRPTTRIAVDLCWRREIEPRFGKVAVVDLTRGQLQRAIDEIAASRPPTARKFKAVVGVLLEHAVRTDVASSNVARALTAPSYIPRSRIIRGGELPRLLTAIDATRQPWRDAFKLMLMTASRRTAVLTMRWEELDLVNGTWTIPATASKSRHATPLPLVDEAVALLKARLEQRAGEPWVFPSPVGGPLRSPREAWLKVCAQAGVSDLRLHDLRRSVGTELARQGASANVIAQALGHRSAASARAYIHLAANDAREHLKSAVGALLKPGRKP
jgi:integrase